MNREIKFRGFSEELKHFVYGFFQEVEAEGIGYGYIFWQGNVTLVRDDSVAQFTGMYDKNNNEIYEKDELLINGIYTCRVKFHKGMFICVNDDAQDGEIIPLKYAITKDTIVVDKEK